MQKKLSPREIAISIKQKTSLTDSGCWQWNGAVHTVGYPISPLAFGGGGYGHRAMFGAVVSPIPKGMYVLHACDNRKCVNPEHLFLGTHLDNIKDMHAKRRQRGGSMPNEKNPNCKFDNSVINDIRMAHQSGLKKRQIEKQFGISETHYYRVIKSEIRKGV